MTTLLLFSPLSSLTIAWLLKHQLTVNDGLF